MKIQNPNPERELIAHIAGEWYTIPKGEALETDDYVIASTLVEHGAVADRMDLEAARILWAERNRGVNSLTASASASEGEIVKRQQATVDVATGVTNVDGPLAGEALKEAVRQANADGAEISSRAKADEQRAALADWQAKRGSSSPVAQFATDAAGSVLVDDDGQPYPLENVELDEDGAVVLSEDGKPVLKVPGTPSVTEDEEDAGKE